MPDIYARHLADIYVCFQYLTLHLQVKIDNAFRLNATQISIKSSDNAKVNENTSTVLQKMY
jgi:hypothetical protein